MAGNMSEDSDRTDLPPVEFLASLSPEEKMLLRLRDELYEGQWDNMRMDLENRLRGKPYIFKLVSRIEHDLQAVEFLDRYEKKNGVDLGRVAGEN